MHNSISTSIDRVDAFDKCGGYTKYVDDMSFENMLYARTLRSERPRAKIISITIPELPDGYIIVDKSDIPGQNRVRMLIYDQPFFADSVVNYIGEPILLVVGPDRDKIDDIISQIVVKYEDMDAIFSIDESESGYKPPIYGDNNCFADYEYSKGNPKDTFADVVNIIEDEYRTGYQEQLYIEPQSTIAVYENNKVTVYCSMQCPFYARNAVMEALGWDENRVRVVQATTGGAFGGKEEYPSITCGHAAIAAVKAGKPVKLIFDRSEDIGVTTKRHPSIIKHRTALDSDNRIIAMDVDIKFDGGAYAGLSDVVLQRGMFAATGVYNIPNLRVRGRAFATNNVPAGAFRGFGAPQAFFAIEMQMEKIAHEINADPVELRLEYSLKKGDITATGGMMHDEVKLQSMTKLICEMSDFQRKSAEFKKDDKHIRRGIGLSLFFHGCGFTGKGEEIINGKVTLQKINNDSVEILISNVEMGQGAQTALRKIVANTLSRPIDSIIYSNPDTDRVPDSGPTVASRTTMIVGGLLEKAAIEMKDRWNESASFDVSKVYKHPEHIHWDQGKLAGDAYPTYSWGVNVFEVEIDILTLVINIKKIWAVFDVGVAIDDKMMRGQIEGGIAQGLGYATIEVMESRNGRIQQCSMADYTIPTASDIPDIESILVENPYEFGPFGAKCAGELTLVGAAPALAAAVSNAIRFQVRNIPVTPEYLMKEIENETAV